MRSRNLKKEEAIVRVGPQRHKKKNVGRYSLADMETWKNVEFWRGTFLKSGYFKDRGDAIYYQNESLLVSVRTTFVWRPEAECDSAVQLQM